ncbi:MAG: hypothetical protein J2P36_26070 [Ktedonobacteraceae bacterium]|nr:hypothetical protein [Ktedonobacteraceae bacterium]
MSKTLITPDATNPASTILELDERWSFVAKKTNQAWIWIALCRQTRQGVASAIGDRGQTTCRRLWEAIPSVYWSRLHRFLGSVSGRDPGGATRSRGKGSRQDSSCRTLEQYAPTTLGSLCS